MKTNIRPDSCKGRILSFIKKSKKWVPSYEIEGFSKNCGYMAGTGTRRVRELAYDGKVKHKEVNKITHHNKKNYKVKIAFYHSR